MIRDQSQKLDYVKNIGLTHCIWSGYARVWSEVDTDSEQVLKSIYLKTRQHTTNVLGGIDDMGAAAPQLLVLPLLQETWCRSDYRATLPTLSLVAQRTRRRLRTRQRYPSIRLPL